MASKFVTKVGKVAWSNIVQPGRNLKDEPEWNCGFVISEGDSQDLMANIEEALRLYRSVNPSFPPGNTGINLPFGPSFKKEENGDKVVEPGFLIFKFKRPTTIFRKKSNRREDNTAPLIFDSMGRPVRNLSDIGSGSLGKVVYDTYCYDKAGQKGVGLQLLGFQVVKLEVQTIELEAVEGGWVQEEAPTAMAQFTDGGSDEVPF
jgi:hypothetical protein